LHAFSHMQNLDLKIIMIWHDYKRGTLGEKWWGSNIIYLSICIYAWKYRQDELKVHNIHIYKYHNETHLHN
jgi:hypothetical protein